jgi:hypothetical protein
MSKLLDSLMEEISECLNYDDRDFDFGRARACFLAFGEAVKERAAGECDLFMAGAETDYAVEMARQAAEVIRSVNLEEI